ncbi:NEDD8-activating enzyme E1 catalytic subunit [Vitis vinifera]|uniref:NEDD8-activating enzyme E1 catalytic subunit n=1 Tax=Vitis vinifera TaxID=29760 RepID=A0A438KKC5_VITVI|nr:NEDD8-activating enzyme E1 catalytic subunit [Vitis vinifera]
MITFGGGTKLESSSRCSKCRLQDVGKPKAEVAAKRVMERVSGVNIVPHFCRIEDKDIEFYNHFNIIALGLDSIEARSYINAVACSFLGAYQLPISWLAI